jgi:hypothetical protein
LFLLKPFRFDITPVHFWPVDLVRHAGHRAQSDRAEALYRTVKPALQLGYQPQNAANRRVVSAIVASMMRLATVIFSARFKDAGLSSPARTGNSGRGETSDDCRVRLWRS